MTTHIISRSAQHFHTALCLSEAKGMIIIMNEYLKWLAHETPSCWWNDSARIIDLHNALENGAQGVTTNPQLIVDALFSRSEQWAAHMCDLSTPGQAEEIIQRVTTQVAALFRPTYEMTRGKQGFVCAQVDPRQAANRDYMLAMARRLHVWAPNIAVKLPATHAGIDVLVECVAEGITVTATVSFTFPQVVEVGRRCQIGQKRAVQNGIQAGQCFAVVMVSRIDDYIRDVALDTKINFFESDIIQCGTAIIKRAYSYFHKHQYKAVLMPAGMRGTYHATELSGANMSMSIHPKIQKLLENMEKPYRQMIDVQVESDVIERLLTIPEFVRAYEPDGMKPDDFITYGVVQKTLAQFTDNWNRLDAYVYDP
jgi:transaldolase